ncbi:hypothetical protein [Hymenobacter sp. CRA2]|nr:hypothetical protein [Hymenobacter sp. CRA2]
MQTLSATLPETIPAAPFASLLRLANSGFAINKKAPAEQRGLLLAQS